MVSASAQQPRDKQCTVINDETSARATAAVAIINKKKKKTKKKKKRWFVNCGDD